MALIKKQLLAKEDMLLSADNTPVSQARAGTIISVHPVNASVIPFDETKSIVEAVEDLAYTHPSKHPVSIIDGSSNPSKFVKTDTLGNTGFDIVTWAEVAGKPNTYTPNSHEHSLDEVTSGTLPASRVAISETRQFITAEQASQLLDMEVKSNKGMPNGYAPLDSNGKINPSFLSALNLVEVFTPADLASMLALTSAQPGDIAYRQDNSTSYMLVALPASTEANWKSLNTGSQVISVNGQTGVVSLNTSNIAESTNLYFTNERVDDRVANLLQAGTNISLAYDDTSNTLTINANDTSVDWSEVQSKPTTISGYSITDAYTKTETNSALSLKAPLASPTFTGTVALPSTTSIGNVSSTELGYLDGVTSSIQTQFNGKVSKTGDETIAGVKTFSSNPISSATQSTAAKALTRKDYVDGLDSANVKRTGDETIAGVKTFSSSPIVPNATTGTQAIAYGQAVKNTGDETIGGVKSFTDGVNLQNQNVSPFSGFKNYIINGNFDVWQYGTSQTTAGYGSDDRWFNASNVSTKTHSRVACTDTERALFNASYFSRTVVTSVVGISNYVNKEQKIEDVTKLAGKTVTLSFWAKADSNKNIAIDFYQYFGTGGTPSSAVGNIGLQTVALTPIWQKKYITITFPSIVGKTLGTDGIHTSYTSLEFWFDTGSSFSKIIGQQSGTFDIAQVQLEEGSVATPFENRPYGLELSLCQRYYEKLTNVNTPFVMYTPNGDARVSIPFKVKKRLIPECAISGTMNSIAVGKDGDAVNIVLTISTVIEKSVDGIYSIAVTNPSALQYCGVVVSGQGHYELTAIASAEL